ncbi:ABC transporter ATP-binding protein [Corynebacterium sp. 335C]
MRALVSLWRYSGGAGRGALAGAGLRVVQSLLLGVAFGAAVGLVADLVRHDPVTAADARRVTLLCAVSLVAQLVVGALSARLSWLAAYRAVGELRLNVLDHLRAVPVSALSGRSRGDVAALLTADLQMIESFLSDGLPRLGQALGLPLIVIVAIAVNDPLLGLAFAVSIVLAVPVMSWSGARITALGDRRQAAQADASARMIDLVAGMPALRVFSDRARTLGWYGAAVENFRSVSVAMVHRLLLPTSAAGTVLLLGVPLVIAVAGLHADPVLAAVALVLVLNVHQPLMGLLQTNESWRMAEASLRRVDAIMDVAPLPEPAPGRARTPGDPVPAQVRDDAPIGAHAAADGDAAPAGGRAGAPVRGHAVELRDVRYAYPGTDRGVRGVTLTALPGRTTAIVGPSGSGKTTLLNLIARFDDPDAGAVLVGGVDLRDIPAEHRGDHVTVVFQDIHLFPGTVADNIAVGRPGASQEDIEAAARAACADGFIRELPDGYATVLGEDGAGLSGGQRQRLSIARALLKDAPVVLLDEATAALDPVNEAEVQKGLRALLRGRTAVVVAHRLGTIMDADEIVVLDDGAVDDRGTHAELLARDGLYARLWRTFERASRWSIGGDARS